MSIPQIQIHQQMAQIGINAQLGKQHLEQPKANFKMRQVDAELQISQSSGRLEIDQAKAWDALSLGGNLRVMSRIYTQASQIALQGLARRVNDGHRLGDIANSQGVNPIPSMAKDWKDVPISNNINGQASYMNVDLNYRSGNLSIDAKPGYVDLQTKVNKPINEYTRSRFDVYWEQKPNIEIIAPQVNTTM